MKRFVLALVIAILCSFALAACAAQYTVMFDMAGGTGTAETLVIKEGEKATNPGDPVREGYTFLGWYIGEEKWAFSGYTVTEDITLTAKWQPRTDISYTVNHYQQNIDGEGYTLYEAQNLVGTADTTVTPAVMDYDGFTCPGTQSATVKPDGSLVVDYYYARNSCTVTFVTNGGESMATATYPYGATLPNAVREGYTFGGWWYADDNLPFQVTIAQFTTDVTLYARWSEETDASEFDYNGSSEITITGYIGTATEVRIPSYIDGIPVKTIDGHAFSHRTDLTSVIIPNSVTSIGSAAFFGCTGLKSVAIGDGVMSIGYETFSGCTGLTSVTIGDGVTSIGGSAFFGCTALTGITIPDSVISIDGFAFSGCTGLKSVTIGDGVTSIGYETFSFCTGLTNITIGNGVTSIEHGVFRGCSGLTSITIPESVKNIGECVLSGCSNLESITIPFVGDCVKTANDAYQYPFGYIFGTEMYSGSIATTQLYYGSNIGDRTSTTYYIPESLKSVTVTGGNILYRAFSECTGLRNIIIGNDITSIGAAAFSGCTGLTSITIPNSVTSIEYSAFAECAGLTSITIPEGVTGIENSTFWGCTGLTSIIIPERVTSIGSQAFFRCTGLTSVTIPDSVTSIGNSAFEGCTGLKSIKYSGTQIQWNNDMAKESSWDHNTGNYTITYNYKDE